MRSCCFKVRGAVGVRLELVQIRQPCLNGSLYLVQSVTPTSEFNVRESPTVLELTCVRCCTLQDSSTRLAGCLLSFPLPLPFETGLLIHIIKTAPSLFAGEFKLNLVLLSLHVVILQEQRYDKLPKRMARALVDWVVDNFCQTLDRALQI